MAFDQWQVVVVPFPFADRPVRRRRPALVVSRPDALGNAIGHSVLAMITSAGHRRWPLDVPVSDLAEAGLPALSRSRWRACWAAAQPERPPVRRANVILAVPMSPLTH